jgi:hypothetical protein
MYWATSPYGESSLLAIVQFLVMAIAVPAVPAVGLALVMLPFRRVRRGAAGVLAVSLFYWPCFMASGRGVRAIRDVGFQQFASRSQGLVDAIHAYEATYGRAPSALADLVPTQLQQIPSTGMGAFPAFEYSDGRQPNDAARWRLMVPVGATVFDWEYLEYRPEHAYPSGAQRYGRWALIVG